MSNDSDKLSPAQPSQRGGVRIWRLARKELRETLRDRRTIVTLILMPLLVYPILSLLFQNFLLSTMRPGGKDGQPTKLNIVYISNGSEGDVGRMIQQIESSFPQPTPGTDEGADSQDVAGGGLPGDGYVPFTQHNWLIPDPPDMETLRDVVLKRGADVGVRFELNEDRGWSIGDFEIVHSQDPFSVQSADYLGVLFDRVNRMAVRDLLRKQNLPDSPPIKIAMTPLESPDDVGSGLAGLVPLILVLMTITGAVYPAIDLTAGERERGTLETLMAAPIPRMQILIAKFVAVLTVAVLTAMLNVIGMATVVWVFQLEGLLFGGDGFTITVLAKIFGLMILFAAFFSAVLLAVTSFARSFKEAQAYLIPLILLSIGPGLLAMTPSLKLSMLMSVTPMINILLLARDVIQGTVEARPAIAAIVSTLAYAAFAVAVAARWFGDDKILYAQGGSFSEMFTRPRENRSRVPLLAAMFALVLLLPLNLVMIGTLGRVSQSLVGQFEIVCGLMAAFTIVSFFVIPTVIAWFNRVNLQSGFGVTLPRAIFVAAAVLLGVSLWPLVMSLVDGTYWIYGQVAGADAAATRHETLVQLSGDQVSQFQQVAPWIIAICFAIVPAVCEEWFFRGMLLRSMLKVWTPWRSILVSALLFGLFHILSSSAVALDRFLPTFLIGVLLGYLGYRSGSILPGIMLHTLHNGIVVFLGYYQEQLSKLSWFPGSEDSLPWWWAIVALLPVLVAVLLIASARPAHRSLRETNASPESI